MLFRSDKLEQENQALKSGLDSVTGFINGSGETKIYQLGETVDIVQNGIKQISIKYERFETNRLIYKITNYNLVGLSPRQMISIVRYNSVSKTYSVSTEASDTILPIYSSAFDNVTLLSYDYIYFGLATGTSYNLFAVFKV